MTQVILSPECLVGLVMSEPAIDSVPAGSWAIEDALLVMEAEAGERQIDCLIDSFRSWREQGRTPGLSGLMKTLRDLQMDGSLVADGEGMLASFVPHAFWQLEHRALRAALGERAEVAAMRAGQRLIYLNALRTMRSNTETNSLVSKRSSSTSSNKRRHD